MGKKAEIALYGSSRAAAAIISWCEGGAEKTEGVGWGGQFGETPTIGGMTEALWRACEALAAKGISGKAAVHIQVGEEGKMAECEIGNPPYFGQLKWSQGPVWILSAEAIEAAAEKGGN